MSTTTTLFGSTEAQAARDLIGGTAIGELRNDLLKQILVAAANRTGGSGGGTWGSITGTLSNQTDLQTALDAKLNKAGGAFTGLTGAGFRDTSAAFDITLGFTSSTALTAARALTLDVVNASRSIKLAGNVDIGGNLTTTGSGTLALGGFTLTVPATGTAALLGTANVFTAAQTITQGTANAGVLASTGYSLTGSNATGMIDLAGTWNTSGTPTAFKLNITNTASNAASKLLDIQAGGTSYFEVLALASPSYSRASIYGGLGFSMVGSAYNGIASPAGGWNGVSCYSVGVQCLNAATFNSIVRVTVPSTTEFGWSDGAVINGASGSIDLKLLRKAAATLQLGVDAAGVTNQMLTAASRITSDGVGANLTIAGGNGRGGAGGSLILSTYSTAGAATIGTLTTRLTLDTTGLLTFADAVNMAFNTTTGTKIGTSATQKLGFWDATPVVRPSAITDAPVGIPATATAAGYGFVDDTEMNNWVAAVNDAKDAVNYILAALRNVGLITT